MQTAVALVALYLGALAFGLIAWTADLWAKSFDFPRAQLVAKIVLTVTAATGATAFVALASFLLASQIGPARMTALALFALPPLAAILWSLHDIDLRLVYLGAILAPLVLLHARMPNSAALLPVALVASLAILSVALVSQVPGLRFRRYSAMLQRACSCCGYKQRALHELLAMGRAGEEAIVKYLQSPEGRAESRVQAVWRECRPTTGCS